MKSFFAVAMVWAVFAVESLFASIGEFPILQPETYSSPSARWKLEVDPGKRDGSGKANYRMTADGGERWAKELPFTLRNAEVTDAGETVGYGYSDGAWGEGSLDVVILDPSGNVRMRESLKRKPSNFPDGLPAPGGAGLLVHEKENRFIMMTTAMSEDGWSRKWLVYQLSNGRKLATFDPREAAKLGEAARSVFDAVPVLGVPLLLEHWYVSKEGARGAVFALVDFKGRKVWSLDLPEDYTISDDKKAEDKLNETIRREGAILDAKQTGEFELRLTAAGERVRFKVERGANDVWKVTETSRAKYQATPEPKPETTMQPEPEVPALKLIGRYALGDAVSKGPIRDMREFDIDGEGRFGFLRSGTSEEDSTFVLVDREADVLAEIPLPATAKLENHCAWLSGPRWILTASEHGVDGKTKAWWFDAETRALTGIEDFKSHSVNVIRGTGDGGFVALSTRQQDYSSSAYLTAYDAAAKPRWRIGEREDDEERSLLSPEDIAVSPSKEIAVLDNIQKKVRIFSLDGKSLRTIDLTKQWKLEPNYPSEIVALKDGGWVVSDFHGKFPVVRMKADGSVSAKFTPKHADGRVIDVDGLRAAPDGGLWLCDGQAFIQVSDQGNAMRTLGSPPDEDRLGEIAALTGDPAGNTYAVDLRSGAVHVFGSDGVKLRVCKPAKDDFKEDLHFSHLAVSSGGGVFLEMENIGRTQRYLHFAPSGERVGVKSLGVDSVTEDWFAQPCSSHMLVLGYEAAFLVNADGKIIRKIERQADRRWFDSLGGAAFAEDGSFAILNLDGKQRNNLVTFFTPEGIAQSTCQIGLNGFSILGGYNGRAITVAGEGAVWVFDRAGKRIGRADGAAELTDHFLSGNGRQLRVVDRNTRQVSCFEMP